MSHTSSQTRRRVNCSLAANQYQELTRQAKLLGLSPTQLLRQAAFAYFQQRFLVPQNLESKLATAIIQLRHIGQSLNQLARHSNTIKNTTIFDLLKAKSLISCMEATLVNLVTNPPHDHQIHEPSKSGISASSGLL